MTDKWEVPDILWTETKTLYECPKVERPLADGGYGPVPNCIWLDGDMLCYDFQSDAQTMPVQLPNDRADILARFSRLSEASDEQILSFARRWGVLSPFARQAVREDEPADYWEEPLSAWRMYARHAKAILNIASELHAGKPGHIEDWEVIFESETRRYRKARLDRCGDLDIEKLRIMKMVSDWLKRGRIHLSLEWRGSAVRVQLAGWGLIGELAAQILLVVGRTDGLAVCSACGSPYVPKRRPRAGQRNYCDNDACQKAKKNDAQRDFRARKKEAGNG